MNSKTAKQIARAASALALVSVTQQEAERPKRSRLDSSKRVEAVTTTARKIYSSLKRRWARTPRRERAALRREMREITRQTKQALARGAATQ